MKMMRKQIAFLRQNLLAMALLLCVLPFWLKAATYEITVSDHWRDELVGNRTEGYSVSTTGGCTVLATLPMDAPQIFAFPFSTNSHVELMLGRLTRFFICGMTQTTNLVIPALPFTRMTRRRAPCSKPSTWIGGAG
jgi:hypothetical protein